MLEVTLATYKSKEKPEEADNPGQHHFQQGSGNDWKRKCQTRPTATDQQAEFPVQHYNEPLNCKLRKLRRPKEEKIQNCA